MAEVAEGRPLTEENITEPNTQPTQSGARVSQGLHGVRERARTNKQERFTALLHHVNIGLLRDSFYGLKRKAAPGVDGVTWKEYETGLEDRLPDLHSRVHRGTYRALPSRRQYIPKSNGKLRPLGIAALEDKIVQSAVGQVLDQIYEEDFRGFSYRFGSGRGQHQALDALYVGIKRRKVNWALDMDLEQEIKQQLRRRMHDPVAQVGGWLRSVLNGYYQYHAIPGNLSVLSRFRRQVARYWFHVLGQRSQRRPTWEKLGKLFDHWLPVPHVVHSCISRRAFRRQPPSGGTSEVRTVCVMWPPELCGVQPVRPVESANR